MILAIVLIVIILIILAVLVVLLVDALVNDSDAVINAPGAGMDAVQETKPAVHEPIRAAPMQDQIAGSTLSTAPMSKASPPPNPDNLTLEASEQRLARLLRDPELRKIPPMIFSEPVPERVDGRKQIVLYPRPPMPLLIPPGPEESIVEQINQILQIRVAGTPLEGRDIRLIESPTRGVIVKVGPLYFDGVDAVTDPEVKAAVQAAVAEWEAEQ